MGSRPTYNTPTQLTKNRAMSTGSFIPVPGCPPTMQPHQQSTLPSTMISNTDTSILAREHRKLDRSMSEPVGMNQNSVNQLAQARQVNSSRYKTELCRPFEENGSCKYGDKCQFAHGGNELRNISRHPKFKTELCRTYHTIGFCPYGHRCHFIHNEEEMKAMQKARQASLDAQVKRPNTINFDSSFNGSMGSNAESLPSSASQSPSLSPTLFMDEYHSHGHISSSTGSEPSSSLSTSPVFNYSSSPIASDLTQLASVLAPLNVQTHQQVNSDVHILQQQLAMMNFNNQHNNKNVQMNNRCVFSEMGTFVSSPSPPDSISGDSVGSNTSSNFNCGALDISKSLRLPIFNKLSQE